ncbi:alpha/beta hydrolase [Brucella pseudogrignonensis]|uniref:alpha/beta hydrolase n=1 Tax=Brucella pseudogrignonensis TaxID=419475 RepID=UPI0038B6706A
MRVSVRIVHPYAAGFRPAAALFFITRAILAIMLTLNATSMETKAEDVTVPTAEQFTMTASKNGHRYRIFLAKPVLPPPPGGYPVIYVLDGNATFQTAAQALRLQTRPPKGFGPAALVGIGYETDEPFDVDARFRDYTTPANANHLPTRKSGEPWPEIGGADAFLEFIRNDLFPEIDRRIAANPERRTLFGHSLGGFFVLNTFLHDSDAFATYVAGSSSIWWNRNELLGVARNFVGSDPDLTGKRLLIGIGGDELDDMLDGSRAMSSILEPLFKQGLDLRYVEFDGEEHVSVLPAMLSRTVTFSLKPGHEELP